MITLSNLLTNFFRLGIVHPNIFIGSVAVGFLGICSLGYVSYLWIKRFVWPWMMSQFTVNGSLVFTLVLFIMLLSRFGVTYTNQKNIIRAPESTIAMDTTGRDWLDGVVKPTIDLIEGKPFNPNIGYGGGIAVSFSPIILLLDNFHLCSIQDPRSCNRIAYPIMFWITVFGFMVWIFVIGRKTSHTVPFLLIFATFLLGVPGSLGLERGNIDILFALFLGWIVYLLSKETRMKKSLGMMCVIGILCGFMVNAKFFFFPYAFFIIYASSLPFTTLISSVCTYIFFSYGSLLFSVPGNILNSFEASRIFIKTSAWYGGIILPSVNHSFEPIASIFTSCVAFLDCKNGENRIVIVGVSVLFFIIVFILPYVRLLVLIFHQSTLTRFLKRVMVLLHQDIKIVLSFLIIVNALVNLLPTISFDYRLYYSIPLLFFFIVSTKNSKSISYAFAALFFLCIKGMWVNLDVNPFGWWPFEARGMNFFLLLHFYFSMKATANEFIHTVIIKK